MKLAKMQIDAVITDVTSEERANPGCEEESVLVDSHSVVVLELQIPRVKIATQLHCYCNYIAGCK